MATDLNWTEPKKILNETSKASPAIAMFDGALHMVHLGKSSNNIFHCIFIFDGREWSQNNEAHPIPNQKSKAPPALATFNGALHMVHLGDSSNNIWHSTSDGENWTANVKILAQKSKATPALAMFNGALHMLHLGESSNNIFHCIFDGREWSQNIIAHPIPNQKSKASPALATSSRALHMVHLGSSSNNIWYSAFEFGQWSADEKIPGQKSKSAPSLAAPTGGRRLLHLVYVGDSSNNLWHSIEVEDLE